MTRYGGVRAMARMWSRVVRTKANNERAVQIRYFKQMWLKNNSPFQLVRNCLESDLNVWKHQWKFARRLLPQD